MKNTLSRRRNNYWRISAIFYFVWFLLLIGAGKAPRTPDFAKLDAELRAAITDKTTSDDVLLESISRLGRVTELPSFWTQIANDPAYSIRHRTRAVFALFRRHGESCGDAASLGRILAPVKWLRESTVERITYAFGWLPIEINPGESVYRISIFHGPNIYLRLQGEVDLKTIVALLQGENARTVKSNPTILQCAYDDGYDEWLRNAMAHKNVAHDEPSKK